MITRLRTAIDAAGVKQLWIASKTGIHYKLLSRYVTGQAKLERDDARKIAKVLSVTIHSLIEE